MPRFFLPLLILSILTCCIEVEISVPGFPDMSAYFHTSETMIQLTIAYNFLGFCLAGLFYGPLSECYGRRKIMLIGNAFLVIGAMGCVWAPSIDWLLIARFIQGIGASTSAVVVFAMLADVYQGEKAAKLIGVMNSILTTLMAIAPVVGGFINETVGWRGNYALVASICLISWLLSLIMLPETKTDRQTFKLMDILKDYGKLLLSFKFVSSSIVPSLLYSAYMSFVACASFLYMETFGLSIVAYACHQGLIVASFSLISFFSGRIIEKFGARGCITKGITMCLIGSITMTITSWVMPMSSYFMTSFMTLFCLGFAICYPVIFASSLEIFPTIKGTASSAIMSMRSLLSSILIGLTGYLYNGEPITVSLVILSITIVVLAFTFKLLRFKQFASSLA